MGRSKLIIKREELQSQVEQLESTNTFENIGALCTAIAESPWGKGVKNENLRVKGISPAKVYASLAELGIKFSTKKGKRGASKGEHRNRSTRGDKLKKNPLMANWRESMNKVLALPEVPDRVSKVVDKAESGNIKAAVALACMNCQGFESTDYRSCQSRTCPLFPVNLIIWPNRKENGPSDAGFGFEESELE